MPRRLSSPAFIGRDPELDALRRSAGAAASGRPRLVLVGGEAGVGKSRLVDELAEHLRADDWLVAHGATVAVGADGLPFEAIVMALREIVRAVGAERVAEAAGAGLADLARLVPELGVRGDGQSLQAGDPDWLQTRTFDGLLGLLGRIARSKPLMLVVEDLHWADRSTRDLVSFVARNAHDERLLMVATIRTDELHRHHPLVGWLAEVERSPRVDRIELRRFDRDELAALLTGILGVPPTAGLLDSVASRSDGNAFFAEELLASVDEAGVARLPSTLREIVQARLAALTSDAARLVEVAAVAGREVDHDLLVGVSGLAEVAGMAAAREAVASHLLITAGDLGADRYRFRHALVQEAVYEEMLPSDRRRLHGAYARAIEAATGSDAPRDARSLVELAYHWHAANEPARALSASIDAADAARASFAYAEAASLYRRAADLWASVEPSERPVGADLASLFERTSLMVSIVGDPADAVALAERAVEELGSSSGSDAAQRRAGALGLLGRAAWLAGDGPRSIAALQQAVDLVEDAPPSEEQARSLAGLANFLMLAGRIRESQPITERAIEMATAVGARDVVANALATLGVQRGALGAVREGIAHLEASLAIATELGEPTLIGRAYANLGTVRQMAGDLEGALATYLEGLESGSRRGDERAFAAFLAINAAGELILLGRHAQAAELLDRAEARGLAPGIGRIHHAITRAELRVHTGDLDGAEADLEAAREATADFEDVQFVGDQASVASELAFARDDPVTALAAVRNGLARIGDGMDARIIGPLALFGARAAADLAVRARAGRDEPAAAAACVEAQAFADRYLGIVSAIDEPDDLAQRERAWVTDLLAAELGRARGEDDPAAWLRVARSLAARPTPYVESYARWRAADAAAGPEADQALRDAHRIAVDIDAPILQARAEALARRRRMALSTGAADVSGTADREEDTSDGTASGATTPAPPDPFGLTPREREILVLVADGLTNRRIAETLFISESTAGVHVSNILGKLGVASRTDAATLAVRLGLDRPGGDAADETPGDPA